MVSFYSENDFTLSDAEEITSWLQEIVLENGFELGEVSYVFCDDEYLLSINQKFLEHDTYTDIITFDYNLGKQINSEIYISTERVEENSQEFNVTFVDELHRVMVHGILHLCGFGDKTPEEMETMRRKENDALEARKFV